MTRHLQPLGHHRVAQPLLELPQLDLRQIETTRYWCLLQLLPQWCGLRHPQLLRHFDQGRLARQTLQQAHGDTFPRLAVVSHLVVEEVDGPSHPRDICLGFHQLLPRPTGLRLFPPAHVPLLLMLPHHLPPRKLDPSILPPAPQPNIREVPDKRSHRACSQRCRLSSLEANWTPP